MKTLVKIFLPLLVLAAALWLGQRMINAREEAPRKPPPVAAPQVATLTLALQDYRIRLASRGVVQPATRARLLPQVGGKVIEISPDFRPGGQVKAGQLLLRLEADDYQHAITVARAELTQANLALSEEVARADQAAQDWQQLALEGEPDPLALRKPQLAGARAAVAAAEARLNQARLDLKRTRILAPWDGEVLTQAVDRGQVVSPGTELGELYATAHFEIRLPLSQQQLGWLPEQLGTPITLSAELAGQPRQWQASLLRREGAVDSSSRRSYVVAGVDDPLGGDGPALRIGQFVEAEIAGHALSNVFVLPRQAVRSNDQVFVLDAEHRLRSRKIDSLWRDEAHVVTRAGLQAGEQLVTTTLALMVDGMPVKTAAEKPGR